MVLSLNWRCREGELDLVATDRKRLVVCVVCEVKPRSGARLRSAGGGGDPAKAAPAEPLHARDARHSPYHSTVSGTASATRS